MLVLGLQGSPRKKGNTAFLLSAFMKEAEALGAETLTVEADKKNIIPCKEYIVCEKKGFCPIKDDMNDIYCLMRKAEIVVMASPVFFYNVTAQLKSMIDRTQTLWARKYKLGLTDPLRNTRKGFMLSVGATKGRNLFEGMHLTAKYFFDAVGASYDGSLTYWKIEHVGDMEKHPTVLEEVRSAVHNLLSPMLNRRKILFACVGNTCRSQMAAGFAQYLAGDRIEALSGGSYPEEAVNPLMIEVMKEKGIDMEFRRPQSIASAIEKTKPERIITMGCAEQCPVVPNAVRESWDIPDPAGQDISVMRSVRDEIEKKIVALVETITH